MKLCNRLNEDSLPHNLPVALSHKIINEIDMIRNHNRDDKDSLFKWRDYIEGLVRYVSHPSIAWDYANKHTLFPNGSRFISDLDYNVGYTVKNNAHGAYVYVFMMNLNLQEFGLKTPSNSMDNQNKQNLNCNKIMKNKKVIRLTK